MHLGTTLFSLYLSSLNLEYMHAHKAGPAAHSLLRASRTFDPMEYRLITPEMWKEEYPMQSLNPAKTTKQAEKTAKGKEKEQTQERRAVAAEQIKSIEDVRVSLYFFSRNTPSCGIRFLREWIEMIRKRALD
jgi:hypothetical protein